MLLAPVISGSYAPRYKLVCVELQAWLSALHDNGVSKPSDPRVIALDTYVRALKTAGVWAKLDMLLRFGSHQQGAALTCMVHPTRLATAVNSPTFTADRGFTGDGLTSYVDLGYRLGTHSVNYTLNNAGISAVSLTAAGNNIPEIGGVSGASLLRCLVRSTANLMTVRCNDPIVNSSSVSHTDGVAMFNWQRMDSTTKRVYRNGAQLGADLTTPSTAMPTTANLWACGAHNSSFSTRQLSMVAAHSALTAGEVSDFYDAEQALQSHLGVTI